jgi:hypothetical protein
MDAAIASGHKRDHLSQALLRDVKAGRGCGRRRIRQAVVQPGVDVTKDDHVFVVVDADIKVGHGTSHRLSPRVIGGHGLAVIRS